MKFIFQSPDSSCQIFLVHAHPHFTFICKSHRLIPYVPYSDTWETHMCREVFICSFSYTDKCSPSTYSYSLTHISLPSNLCTQLPYLLDKLDDDAYDMALSWALDVNCCWSSLISLLTQLISTRLHLHLHHKKFDYVDNVSGMVNNNKTNESIT